MSGVDSCSKQSCTTYHIVYIWLWRRLKQRKHFFSKKSASNIRPIFPNRWRMSLLLVLGSRLIYVSVEVGHDCVGRFQHRLSFIKTTTLTIRLFSWDIIFIFTELKSKFSMVFCITVKIISQKGNVVDNLIAITQTSVSTLKTALVLLRIFYFSWIV